MTMPRDKVAELQSKALMLRHKIESQRRRPAVPWRSAATNGWSGVKYRVALKEVTGSSRRSFRPGARAPDFTLHSTPDQEVSLSDFNGKRLILVFYPAD